VAATITWFDLWMEFDQDGRRFERFDRSLPCELSAGAHVVVPDGYPLGTRHQKVVTCFSGVPFERVPSELKGNLERYLPTIEGWDVDQIRREGQRVKLGGRPHPFG
jgi:hypothetical protein